MDWVSVDERLIKRGELLLSLDFLETYDDELKAMNRCKEGHPFNLTDSHIVFLAVVRYLFGLPYRQLEGFTRALNRLLPRLPPADYSGLRRRVLGIDLSPYEELEGSDDVAVDVETKQALALMVTTDGILRPCEHGLLSSLTKNILTYLFFFPCSRSTHTRLKSVPKAVEES